jgi:YVTN family beta-propeller protein
MSDTVSVINTATNTVKSTVNVGDYPIGIAVVGNYVYVANGDDNTISVINEATNTVISTLNIGNDPSGIASARNYVYI